MTSGSRDLPSDSSPRMSPGGHSVYVPLTCGLSDAVRPGVRPGVDAASPSRPTDSESFQCQRVVTLRPRDAQSAELRWAGRPSFGPAVGRAARPADCSTGRPSGVVRPATPGGRGVRVPSVQRSPVGVARRTLRLRPADVRSVRRGPTDRLTWSQRPACPT